MSTTTSASPQSPPCGHLSAPAPGCRGRRATLAAGLLALLLAVPLAAHAAIAVNKSFAPDAVSAGQTSTLTIFFLNANPADATALSVADSLPAGIQVAAIPGAATTCGGTVTANPGATTVSLAGGTIPAAIGAVPGNCQVTVTVVAPASGVFINTIPVDGASSSQGGNSQAAAATLTVSTLVPITGVKAFNPTNLHGNGAPSRITITLTNPNGVPLTNVAFTDNLVPPGVVVAPTPNAATTCGGVVTAVPGASSASLAAGTINPSSNCQTSFDVVLANPNTPADANATNTIGAGTVTTAQGVSNSSFSATVRRQAAAQVVKTFAPATITSGGTSTVQFEIRNYNGVALAPVNFSDALPAGMTVAATPNATTTCTGATVTATGGGTTIAIAGGSLAAAPAGIGFTSCTIRVDVTATNAGAAPVALANSVPAGNFNGVNYNASSATLTVNPVSNISATKSFATPNGPAVQTNWITTTVTLRNTDVAPATVTSFTDSLATMGAGYTIAAYPPATAPSTTCAGGAVTAVAGATSFTMAGGVIPAGGQCTITVPVQIGATAATGNRTNTIAAGAIQTSSGNNTVPVTATVSVGAALSTASKAFNPTTVIAGSVSRLTINLGHANGAVPFTNLAFTDTLPAGHTVATPPNVVGNCGGTVTATGGTNTIQLAGGTLAAGATSCSIAVDVRSPVGAGASTNTIGAGTITTAQGVTNAAAVSATLTRITTSVNLAKSFTPATVALGGTSQMTFRIINTNPNAVALTGGAITDTLPAGMTLTAAPGAVLSGCTGTVTAPANGGVVSLSNLAIAVSATCTLTVNVRANAGGNLINRLNAGAFSSAQGVTNTQGVEATLASTGNADLRVTKTDGVTNVTPGGSTTYTIVASNAGPNDVAGATFTDTPPAGVTFTSWTCVPAPGSVCTASGSGPISDSVTLPSGGQVTYTITAAIASSSLGTIANTASIVTPPTVVDSNPANNTATDTDTLVPQVALAVAKTDGSPTYTPGSAATYTITVTDLGPSDATAVNVVDNLPPGVTLTGTVTCAAGGAATCGTPFGTTGQTSLGTNGGSIPFGAGNAIVLTAPVAFAAGMTTNPLINSVTATNVPTGSTASSSDTDTLLRDVNLGVTKTDGSATYTPGGAATYTVTVVNAGPSNATAVAVSDPLPAGVTLAGAATCAATGGATCGTVTGSAGQTGFGTTGATIDAGAGNSLVFTVPVAFAANLTTNPLVNTATATDPAALLPAQGQDSDALALNVVLAVTKTDGSATYTPGGTATYAVTVRNTGLSNATGVAVTDALPAGLTLAGTVTCAPTGAATCGTVTGTIGQTSFGATGATLGAGAANALTFTVPVAFAADLTTNPLVNTATATDVPTGATASGSDSDALALNVVLAVAKTDGSATYTPGGTGTYTVTVTNNGTSDALGVNVGDALPAGVTLAANATCAANGNAGCGTVTGSTGQASFGATGARVGAGGGNSLVFTVPVAYGAAMTADPLLNTATANDVPSGSSASGVDASGRSAQVTLAVAKTDGSASYTPGGTATYTVTVTNTGLSSALGVSVTDALPAGVTLTGAATCVPVGAAACGTVTGSTGQASFGATGATIAAGAGNALVFTVPVAFASGMTADPLVNTATATDVPSGATASGSDSDSRSLAVTLAVTKTDGSATYVPGGTATYTVTVANTGASDALGVAVADALPAGVTLSGAVSCAATGTAACGTVTGVAGQTSFGATGATIAAGAGNSLVFTVPVTFASGMTTDPLVNTATANDVPSGASASGADSDARAANVSLAVVKTDGSTSYTPGGTATYTVTVTNGGTSDALGVNVTDALPAGVTLAAAATCAPTGIATCGTVTGGAGQASFGATGATIAAGGGNALVFTVPVAFAAGMTTDPLVNVATATDVPSGAAGSGSDSDARAAQVTLAVSKTDGSPTYVPGGTATYTIVVGNTGASDALNVTVADPLPAGVTLTGAATCVAAGTATCGTVTGSAGQGSFGATGATLPAGPANTLTFAAPVAFAANLVDDPLINAVAVSDAGSGASGTATDSDARAAQAVLAVTKTDGSSTYTPGGTATYTVTVTNAGPSDALSVTVADPLPAGVTLTGAVTCATTGTAGCGTVTGAAGQTSFGATAARVAAGAGNSLVFTVPVAFAAAMTADPLVNTATATDPAAAAPATGSDSDARTATVTLAATKTDGSATYTPGGTATYTITVANTGLSNALGVTVSDPLPAGVTLAANATCVATGVASCGAVTGAAGQSSFGATGASIAAGPGNLLTFSVPVAFAAGLATDPLVNVVTATDPAATGTATASDSNTRAGQAGLAVTKTDGSATYTPGGTATYTITVTNAGPSDANTVTVSDSLPAGVTLAAGVSCVATGNAACGTVSGSSGQASFGATGARVGAGAGNTLVFTVPVAFASALVTNPLVNMVTVTDPSSAPAVATDSNTRAGGADVTIVKQGPSLVPVNGDILWTLAIGNLGPSAADGATFSDPLPAGVTNVTVSCGGAVGGAACGAVSYVGGVVSGVVAALPVGGRVVITIRARAPSNGAAPLVNTATVTPPPGTTDPNPANSSSSATTALSGGGGPNEIPVNAPWAVLLSVLLAGVAGAARLRGRRNGRAGVGARNR